MALADGGRPATETDWRRFGVKGGTKTPQPSITSLPDCAFFVKRYNINDMKNHNSRFFFLLIIFATLLINFGFYTNAFAATITVTSPNGGESWAKGSTHLITWTSTGITNTANVNIKLYKGGVFNRSIITTPNTGTYAWTLPNISDLSVGANYKVRIATAYGSNVNASDYSNNNFTITVPTVGTPPSATVTYSPLGDWVRGTTKIVNWPTASFNSNVEVWLCTQSNVSAGVNVATAANNYCRIRLGYNLPNTGRAEFTVTTSVTSVASLYPYYFYVRKVSDSANTYAGNAFSGNSVIVVNATTVGTWTLGACSATQCGTVGLKTYTCQPSGATCSGSIPSPATVGCSAPACAGTPTTVTYTPPGNWARNVSKTVNWTTASFNTNVEVWLCKQSVISGKTVAETASAPGNCPSRLRNNLTNDGSESVTVPTSAVSGNTYYFYVRKYRDSANTYTGNAFSGNSVRVVAGSTVNLPSGQGCLEGTCVCVNGQAKRCGNPMQSGVGCPATAWCPVGVSMAPGDRLVASLGALIGRFTNFLIFNL